MEPGVYTDLSNDDYHNGPGISKTGLDWIAKCPALYKAKYITKEIEDKETTALAVGKALHLAVFQPEIFDTEVAVLPEINQRTNAGKEQYAAFCADNAGKSIITPADYETVKRVADAVRQHPMAKEILAEGQAETSIFSLDKQTGELVKVRPDWIHQDLLVDLKSIRSASPYYFEKEMWDRRYFVQSAFYLDVANQEMGLVQGGPDGFGINRFNDFLFICAEKEPPYLVEIYFANREVLEIGRIEYRRNLKTYSQCKASGVWPGYNNGKIVPIGMPHYATKRYENVISE